MVAAYDSLVCDGPSRQQCWCRYLATRHVPLASHKMIGETTTTHQECDREALVWSWFDCFLSSRGDDGTISIFHFRLDPILRRGRNHLDLDSTIIVFIAPAFFLRVLHGTKIVVNGSRANGQNPLQEPPKVLLRYFAAYREKMSSNRLEVESMGSIIRQ